MSEKAKSVTQTAAGAVPEIADSENEAIIDASRTFLISVIAAGLFCLAALFIILRTRMG